MGALISFFFLEMLSTKTTVVLLLAILYLISSHAECHLTVGRSLKRQQSHERLTQPMAEQFEHHLPERHVYPELYDEDYPITETRTRPRKNRHF